MKNIKDKGPLAREMLRLYETFSSEIKFTELADPLETWELQELVGEGTYGVVHSARHKQTGEIVAVKILEAIHELIEEIEEEYVILRDLGNHPNMPKFHGIYLRQSEFRGEDQLWIAMELCGRGSVTHLTRELMKQKSAMDEKLIAHILGETLKVLVHLHTNHIIHRDIKGHNILITDEGKVKLIDFGVSTTLKSTNDRRRTSVGTPYWMAPEVIACERQLEYNYDLRCDIWSLGITAIELADGEPPLADLHPMRALFKIPRNPTPTLTKPAQWSDEFNDFVSQCLIKDFELRPQARDLLNHPFIQQVAAETSVYQRKLHDLTSSMDQTVHQPDVTVKKGRPKSHRKSKRGDTVKSTEDLATLEILDEGVIVSQLRSRYKDEEIYTYIGDILLAVNPFQPINIYNDEYSKMYMNAAKDANPPHIYAVADQSYQMMMHYKKHQCIVISGESGAGKTESANLMVQQLTQLGKAGNRTLEERILQVNPLMEAFGNAKTVINDNSSRFGKYLEMFFTISGTVIGAKITEYLLEKSRVISQARGEQNFHIFYYIHDGLSSEEKKTQFLLKENVPYRYIEEYTSGGIDIAAMAINRVKFKAIQHCFDIIGFKPKEVSSVCGIIASILNLGNVNFDEKETGHGGNACSITSRPLVEAVSSTLGIPNVELVEALTTTGMVARGELIVRGNSVPEALDARDAMAKALYGRLFSWIVNHINILLKPQTFVAKKEEENHIIGILDIFGFEHIPNNSFEQLCINIANEQIQYYFNQHIFAWEMQEYQNEGLEVLDITFVDNRPLLDMFLMKPLGLLALLDEESHFPKATDKSLVEKFHRNINNKYYCRPKGNSLVFSIDHYAGRVEYDANGFLEKNRDRLPGDVLNMLRASSNEVVRALFQTPLTKTGNLASGSIASSLRSTPSSSAISSPASTSSYVSVMSYNKHQQTSGMGGSRGSASASMTRIQQTVATYFRFSLMDLLAKMVAGTPHFVRCIRPNANKHPDDFNSEKVTIQLRYTGVLETTRIRREGYSHRIPFADFLRRYHMLSFRWDERVPHTRDSCYTLLDRLGMDHFALGKTKVFLKYYHIEQLARQYEAYHRKVITLQSVIRSWHARTLYYRNKWQREKAATLIQSRFRGFVIQRKFQKEFKLRKGAAVAIQTAIKGFLVRRKTRPVIEKRRKATVLIQSKIRGHLARKSVREQKTLQEKREKSAISIQKAFRSYRARINARQLRKKRIQLNIQSAIMIQKYYRRWRCRTVYQQLLLYKSQRDTQVLFFTQQVEMYNKDLLQNMMKNMAPRKMEPKMEDQTKRKKSLAPGPPTNATPLPVTVPEPPPPPAQVTKEVDNIYAKVVKPKKAESPKPRKPEVSEERLHQIFKMNELKSVMPPIETKYYDELNNFVPDPDYPGSEEEVPVTVVRADVHPPPPSVPEHLIRKSETKSVMKTENESYYHDITEDILAPPSESDSTYHVPSDQIVDWDVPLLQAKHNALSLIKENKTNGVHKPTDDSEDKDDSDSERTKLARSIAEAILNKGDSSIPLTNGHHYIEEDPAPIHDELQSEYSKQDLAKRLEDECAGSVVSLWQQRQRKPNESGTNGTNTQPPPPPLHPPPSIPRSRMAAPVLTIPPPPSSPPPPTPPRKSPSPVVLKTTPPKVDVNGNENMMSPPSASKVKFALTPSIIPQSSTNGHVNVTSDNNDPTSDFRKRLRKTNIDLSQDNIFKATSAESEPKHFDFRSRLKKTGRIPETK
ncbi:myosin-IIIb-like isoform X9 [Mizuhopecten yessoensis]|uniref:myosin-IIIb-like isoform X9 n=1 Tax=Mizuhopecten yessoensis TaxID=6573 RepID=UPI000B45CD96|nr:myosin-IIIb-like isoform X9 [Mizuhopecten yessoensis]